MWVFCAAKMFRAMAGKLPKLFQAVANGAD
jgi:hypothetical protein